MISQLEFDKATEMYQMLVHNTNENTFNEIWASNNFHNIDPFDFQRLGLKKGNLLIKKPVSTKNKICYIFDRDEKIISIKHGLSIPGQFNQEFFYIEDSQYKSCLFRNDNALINIKVRVFEGDKINNLSMKGVYGYREESYFYSDDRLTRIRVRQWEGPEEKTPYTATFTYSNDELESIINEFDNGYKEIAFPRK